MTIANASSYTGSRVRPSRREKVNHPTFGHYQNFHVCAPDETKTVYCCESQTHSHFWTGFLSEKKSVQLHTLSSRAMYFHVHSSQSKRQVNELKKKKNWQCQKQQAGIWAFSMRSYRDSPSEVTAPSSRTQKLECILKVLINILGKT